MLIWLTYATVPPVLCLGEPIVMLIWLTYANVPLNAWASLNNTDMTDIWICRGEIHTLFFAFVDTMLIQEKLD